MELTLIIDQEFKGIDFQKNPLQKAEYDTCTFVNCNLSSIQLSNIVFVECFFIDCNLSLSAIKNTSFKDVNFENCKLLGLQFNECNSFLLNFTFTGCILNLTSFFKLNIPKTIFTNCKLEESDFVEANLANSIFDNCDLTKATFENTNLEKVNFSTSYNYTIDPEINRLKKATFSKDGLEGLLQKHQLIIT